MNEIPLTIAARNEARAIGPCLDALLAAIVVAEAELPLRVRPLVVADRCDDDTEAIARARGVEVLRTSGGKVEAQRRGVRPGPFQIFCDADVLVARNTILALCQTMLDEPTIMVAFPRKQPLPPRRVTPLAWALHVYNRQHGFSSQRTWFSGKLFAIREWSMPTRAEVERRARSLTPSRFYDYDAGMRIDDIWLSRSVVDHNGPQAIRETAHGELRYRAPETFVGMYRYYRRMRMELERLDALFPETVAAHRRFGTRRPDQLAAAKTTDRLAFAIFGVGLLGCRGLYRLERAYYERWSASACDPWPAVTETKQL